MKMTTTKIFFFLLSSFLSIYVEVPASFWGSKMHSHFHHVAHRLIFEIFIEVRLKARLFLFLVVVVEKRYERPPPACSFLYPKRGRFFYNKEPKQSSWGWKLKDFLISGICCCKMNFLVRLLHNQQH